jgi:hypothetical protein
MMGYRMARLGVLSRFRWIRPLRTWLPLLAAAFLSFGYSGIEAAEPRPSREFQIKAAFLYNFAQFVDWPEESFESPESPLIIAVLGEDPFGSFLDDLVRGERANGRPLIVRRFPTVEELGKCHVLFVSGSEGRQIERIVERLRRESVLTVCDWEEYARQGAIVWFVMERNRVRLRINLDAAKTARLTISSKLLRSAETVTVSNRE